MAMTNMDWIRLAATGGRDANMQLASVPTADTEIKGNSKSGPESSSEMSPSLMTITIVVDRFESLMRECEVYFVTSTQGMRQNLTESAGVTGNGAFERIDGDGKIFRENMLVPQKGGTIKIQVKVFDFKKGPAPGKTTKTAAGQFSVNTQVPKNSGAGELFVKITPDIKEREETESEKTSRTDNSARVDIAGTLGSKGSVGFLGTGAEANASTTGTRQGATRSEVTEQAISRTKKEEYVAGIKAEVSIDDVPQTSSQNETGQTSAA